MTQPHIALAKGSIMTMDRHTTEIVDLTILCHTFPDILQPVVNRDHYLNEIESLFRQGAKAVFLTGDPGSGKSILLAHFARRYPNTSFSVFIRPGTMWSHDPQYVIFDLCNQLEWHLHQRELPSFEDSSASLLQNQLFRLHRHARRSVYTFVIDGLLTDSPLEDYHSHSLLSQLPLSMHSNVRFLFSGSPTQGQRDIFNAVATDTLRLTGFSEDDTIKYFAGYRLDNELLKTIHVSVRGMPSSLSSIKRSLDAGVALPSTVDTLNALLSNVFQIEWSHYSSTLNSDATFLALVAFSRTPVTVALASLLLGLTETEVHAKATVYHFLTITTPLLEISFISDQFRAFAATQMDRHRRAALELLTNYLLANPADRRALTDLPEYLERDGQHELLLEFLKESLPQAIESSHSIDQIRQLSQTGMRVASNARLGDGPLMMFATMSSVVGDFARVPIQLSEVEALIALGENDAAIALAQSAVLVEDRLELLATITREQYRRGAPTDEQIVGQLRDLATRVDPSAFDTRLVEIASKLIYTTPDLAVELIERGFGSPDNDNALDWAMASLTLRTAVTERSDEVSLRISDNLRDRVSDPELRSLLAATTSSLAGQTAERVCEAVETITGASNQLFLLRRWCLANPHRADAGKVISTALSIAISTTDYAPNAKLLRDLAEPLSSLPADGELPSLIHAIESQLTTVEDLSASEEFVLLQLLIARAEKEFDYDSATERLVRIYFTVSGVADTEVKCACLAHLLVHLDRIDSDGSIEEREGIASAVEVDLERGIDRVLTETGYQDDAISHTVSILAESHPELALRIAMLVNTGERRDRSARSLIEAIAESSLTNASMNTAMDIMSAIADRRLRDHALFTLIEAIPNTSETRPLDRSTTFRVADSARAMLDAGMRCTAIASIIPIVKLTANDDLLVALIQDLRESWHSIDSTWQQVDAAFRVAAALGHSDSSLGKEFLALANDARSNATISAGGSAETYIRCVRLAVRAYRGLFGQGLDDADDETAINDLLRRLPSDGERAVLSSDLAARMFASDRISDARRIVNTMVRPLIDNIALSNSMYRDYVVTLVAPVLYATSSAVTIELLEALSDAVREDGYISIVNFLLFKVSPTEPYDASSPNMDTINYDNALEVLNLLHNIKSDGRAFYYVEIVVSAALRNRFSRQQRESLADKIEDVLLPLIPRAGDISHDGYRILTEAQVLRLRGTDAWESLIDRATAIANVSDRAFVVAVLASALPARRSTRARELMQTALHTTSRITSQRERMVRLTDIASIATDTHSSFASFAKDCLEEAIRCSPAGEETSQRDTQRRVIDLAHRINPEFAASLASLSDNDPSRKEVRDELSHRAALLQTRDQMVSATKSDPHSPQMVMNMTRAAWMNLRLLNTGTITTIQTDRAGAYLPLAASIPMGNSYPTYAWAIENAVQRLSNTPQARTLLRAYFDGLIESTRFAEGVSSHINGKILSARRIIADDLGNTMIISPGQRDVALRHLSHWLLHDASEFVIICDAFFGLEELGALRLVLESNPELEVTIVTSKKHLLDNQVPEPYNQSFRNHWRLQVANQDPPPTIVHVLYTRTSNRFPIHDRWWLSKNAGLDIGTSFNGLGLKESKITRTSTEDAKAAFDLVDSYVRGYVREHLGERLDRDSFTM